MIQCVFKRVEMKYMLNREQYERLQLVMSQYMVGDEWGASTVRNVYFDTQSKLLIRRSSEKPQYKEKIRIRSYHKNSVDEDVFVELKKKFDGVVYKRRATMSADRAYVLLSGNGSPETQIERELDFTCRRYGGLVPAFFIAYDREAFYAKDNHDFRMTFDSNIRYRDYDMSLCSNTEGVKLIADDKVLLEVKSGGAMPLWLVDFLSEEKIRKVGFSKVGAAYATSGREVCVSRNFSPVCVSSGAFVPQFAFSV